MAISEQRRNIMIQIADFLEAGIGLDWKVEQIYEGIPDGSKVTISTMRGYLAELVEDEAIHAYRPDGERFKFYSFLRRPSERIFTPVGMKADKGREKRLADIKKAFLGGTKTNQGGNQ